MKFRQIAFFAVVALVCTLAAHAGTVTFDLSMPSGLLGVSQMYTAGPFTITAFGFDGTGAPTDLYGKNLGFDETGLGLNNDPSGQHEISGMNYIQLDLTSLLHNPGLAITIASVQTGETFDIYGSDTMGTLGSLLFMGNSTDDQVPISLTGGLGGFDFYSVMATNGNVIIENVAATTSTVPEPGTLVMFGSGIVVLAGVLRRKLRM